MAPLQPEGTVAVTGGTGYVGSWIVKTLLDRGYRVCACVRDANHAKADFLKQFPAYTSGRLTVHSCDMRVEGAFDEVFAACNCVIHTAADPDLPLERRNEAYQSNCQLIIDSINKSASATRVVYTSSAAAIAGDDNIQEYKTRPVIDEGRYPNMGERSEDASRVNGYVLGKLTCEKLFFEASAASCGRWEAIVTNPSDNIGPLLSAHQNDIREAWAPWHTTIAKILEGREFPQSYGFRPWWTVDVRDTAEAHVRLLESSNVVSGHRYFICSTDTIVVEDIGGLVKELFPEAGFDPALEPFGHEGARLTTGMGEAEVRSIWACCKLRNDKISKEVGMTFRPLATSLHDCVESLFAVAGVKPRTSQAKHIYAGAKHQVQLGLL